MEPALLALNAACEGSGAERESLRNRYGVIPSERRRVFLVSSDSVGRDLLFDLSRQVSQESLCALCIFAFIFLLSSRRSPDAYRDDEGSQRKLLPPLLPTPCPLRCVI